MRRWPGLSNEAASADAAKAMSDAYVGLVLYGSALFFLLLWLRARFDQQQLSTWMVTEGSILAAHIEDDEDGPLAVLLYRYSVNGQEWTSDQIYPGNVRVSTTWARARRVIARYAPGTAVHVFYDPLNPARAVLEPRLPSLVHWISLLACGGSALGGYLLRNAG